MMMDNKEFKKENLDPSLEKDPWTENDLKDKPGSHKTDLPHNATLPKNEHWEKDLVNRLAFASLNEQRRSRRWSIFFRSAFLLYLIVAIFLFLPDKGGDISLGHHTAVIEVKGVIAENAFASADNIIKGLRGAFKDDNTKGIVLRINSPGGSAVQAGYIYDEIKRLRKIYPDTKVYAVITDIGASAAYYIAAAADEIYADKASLVGSIGVLMDGYGFVDTLKKLGVERRLLTAGENKGFLDPFTPINEAHQQHMQSLLDNVHNQFIEAVKKGRGDRLGASSKIVSGLVWSGEKSVELGLIDGLASTSKVARDIIGVEKIADFTPRLNYIDRFADKFGASIANSFMARLLPLNIQ